MHYVHIAGPETYKAAIMIAKMLNDILLRTYSLEELKADLLGKANN